MFWRDPNLYGVSLPYRELNTPVQTPFMGFGLPWQNIPRFMPPTYGFLPQLHMPQYGLPQFNIPQYGPPQLHMPQLNIPQIGLPQFNMPQVAYPLMHTQAFNPYIQPYLPYTQPFDVNLYRPFVC